MLGNIKARTSLLRCPLPALWPYSWAQRMPSWLAVKRTTARLTVGLPTGAQPMIEPPGPPHQRMALTTFTPAPAPIRVFHSAWVWIVAGTVAGRVRTAPLRTKRTAVATSAPVWAVCSAAPMSARMRSASALLRATEAWRCTVTLTVRSSLPTGLTTR